MRKEKNPSQITSVAESVDAFFRHLLTQPNKGICLPSKGWYSSRMHDIVTTLQYTAESVTKHQAGDIHNKIISRFLNSLKPGDDPLQSKLLVDILEACPELVSP